MILTKAVWNHEADAKPGKDWPKRFKIRSIIRYSCLADSRARANPANVNLPCSVSLTCQDDLVIVGRDEQHTGGVNFL